MEATTTTLWTFLALALLLGVAVGYIIGARKTKKLRREFQRELNEQCLKLLDAQSDNRHLAQFIGSADRKDRLLKLTLGKLRSSSATNQSLTRQLNSIERDHFIVLSKNQVSLAESKQRAKIAAEAAREASLKLSLLERALPQLQTITAPEPKSYGHGEPVTVSVVDQKSPRGNHDHASAVTNRDLHRLQSMHPVNETIVDRPDNTVTFPAKPHPSAQKSTNRLKSEQRLSKNRNK